MRQNLGLTNMIEIRKSKSVKKPWSYCEKHGQIYVTELEENPLSCKSDKPDLESLLLTKTCLESMIRFFDNLLNKT